MNIEEIKMITETISTLGVQGKEAFIWWLILDKGLCFLVAVFLIIAAYKAVIHLVFQNYCVSSLKRLYFLATGRSVLVFVDEADVLCIEEKLKK